MWLVLDGRNIETSVYLRLFERHHSGQSQATEAVIVHVSEWVDALLRFIENTLYGQPPRDMILSQTRQFQMTIDGSGILPEQTVTQLQHTDFGFVAHTKKTGVCSQRITQHADASVQTFCERCVNIVTGVPTDSRWLDSPPSYTEYREWVYGLPS